MSRRKGFSLVELLIVLAVIAALIATITPVALNAIRKAKATQVAQNLKTLASALENAAYVNGVNNDTEKTIKKSGTTTESIGLTDLGRDIKGSEYAVYYKHDGDGKYSVKIISIADAAIGQVQTALKDAFTGILGTGANEIDVTDYESLTGTGWPATTPTTEIIAYSFTFSVY